MADPVANDFSDCKELYVQIEKKEVGDLKENFKKGSGKLLWPESAYQPVITVSCKKILAELHKERFCSGTKGRCIKYKDKWFSPQEFEFECGIHGRKWKSTIKYSGQSLASLFRDNILPLHNPSCSCSLKWKESTDVSPLSQPMLKKRKCTNSFKVEPSKKKSWSMPAAPVNEYLIVERDNNDDVVVEEEDEKLIECGEDEEDDINVKCHAKNFHRQNQPAFTKITMKSSHSAIVNTTTKPTTENPRQKTCITDRLIAIFMSRLDELKELMEEIRDSQELDVNELKNRLTKQKNQELRELESHLLQTMNSRLAQQKKLHDIQLQELLIQSRLLRTKQNKPNNINSSNTSPNNKRKSIEFNPNNTDDSSEGDAVQFSDKKKKMKCISV
ncbi:hypothetical protein HELRODRAFT_183791 [Helobdella robusta]|uniref:SAND domain-containing protein n=1 Tax=Helobdella robusta TaxID=6412 RepID=T1FK71_HELRO|nr:hypothetical protein HELRODRAFT_183791 [Helobdella robusta]ESO10266.1 hypothetical protein HELRODRAFT_183791 [Helobdella robusta]